MAAAGRRRGTGPIQCTKPPAPMEDAFEDMHGARGGIGVQKLSRVAWVGARAGMSVRGVEVLSWLTRLGRLEGLGWWDGRRG